MGKILEGDNKMRRHITDYPGVSYRVARRVGAPGTEKVFYVRWKDPNGKMHEEKAGRQYRDDMTPSRAARIRADFIEGKRDTAKQKREKAAERVWTLTELWEEYFRFKAGTGWAAHSIATDKGRFYRFLKDPFGDKKPEQISPIDVDRMRIRMSKTHKLATVYNALELLRRLVNFGVNRGFCPTPGFKIRLPKLNNIVTEFLSEAELERLFEAINRDFHPYAGPIMMLALFTGMRKSELLRLQWGDIDFKKGFILIRTPKGGLDQTIPLSSAAEEVFTKRLTPQATGFVFSGKSGGQLVEIGRAVRRIAREAGLPEGFRPLHGLRHTYASLLASSGEVDLFTLQKLLTHKSPQMTQRYAHLRDDVLKRAAEVAVKMAKPSKQRVLKRVK